MRLSRQAWAWALYDFASSAFTTLVVTFIFSAFFARAIAPDPDRGALLWSVAVNVSAVLVAVMVPLLGAVADAGSSKKRFLAVATLMTVIATAGLAFAGRGDVALALTLFVIANVGFEAANVFYNAFLPEVSPPEELGRSSGAGQALGYIGGLITLVAALVMIRTWNPADDLDVRATNLLVAGWYGLFALPLFFIVREQRRRAAGIADALRAGASRLRGTVARLKGEHRQPARLMIARMIYNDGLTTVFAFASIFAAATFGMDTQELILLGIVLNVVSAGGSAVLGPVTDRIGPKKTIGITLAGLIVATIVGATAPDRTVFWCAAVVLGAMIGPNQAASRSFLAQLTPADKHAEFFGFYAFSGRLAAVLGPALYGVVLRITASQRWAIGSSVLFFIAGWLLLLRVSERRVPPAHPPGSSA